MITYASQAVPSTFQVRKPRRPPSPESPHFVQALDIGPCYEHKCRWRQSYAFRESSNHKPVYFRRIQSKLSHPSKFRCLKDFRDISHPKRSPISKVFHATARVCRRECLCNLLYRHVSPKTSMIPRLGRPKYVPK